jgi:hemolysin activation/secretion protein
VNIHNNHRRQGRRIEPMNRLTSTMGAVALLLASGAATAQATTGQAGMELQGQVPPRPLSTSPGAVPSVPAPAPAAAAASGGPRVTLEKVVFDGNQSLDSATLLAALGKLEGQRFDLAGLDRLAQAVMTRYRAAGYPFAQALIPPQSLQGGTLTIQVLEGRFGAVTATGTDPLLPGAQPFLDHGLRRGDAIRADALERTMLLLDDQPGFQVHPVLRPGAQRGEGDLVVSVERERRVQAEVGLDNAGNRSTGEYRARASVALLSPWRFGDRLAINAMVTDRRLWLGSVDYDAPIGPAGTRGQVGIARTSYQLGGAFAALDASGRADVATLRLSHAVLRSQASNLLVSAALQHKALRDEFRGVSPQLVRDKTSRLLLATAQFDHRDGLLGGGVTYGALNLTAGRLSLDAAAAQVDAASARSAGDFSKWALDVARIQRLPGAFSLYGRVSGQGASKNLDASEKFAAGGFLGVRAYPMGEASGDAGWLGQVELRWSAGAVTPFLFADAARVRVNHAPWDAGVGNRRSIAGAGVGLRWQHGGWSLESTLASRTQGGAPQADGADRKPRLFVSLGHRFD